MFIYNIRAIIWKEILQIIRDPFTLIMMFLIPIFQLTIFGFAVNMDVQHIPTVIYNQDNRKASRELIMDFVNTKYFDIVGYVNSPKQLHDQIVKGKAKVGINIPPDYSVNLLRSFPTSIQILIDGSNSTMSMQALNVSRAITQKRSIEITQKRLARIMGVKLELIPPIEDRPKVLFNPDLKSANFMVPGLLGIIMQLITILLTAFAIVREKERGTLEQLIVTPIRPFELMIGKLSPYFIISMIDMILVLICMIVIFHVPISGSLTLLIILSILFLITSLAIGLLISTIANNQIQAMQMTFLFYLPSIMLSGFVFPRETMPLLINWFGYLIPLTYFLEILRGIILRGVGINGLWDYIIPIIGFGIFFITLSIVRFNKKII